MKYLLIIALSFVTFLEVNAQTYTVKGKVLEFGKEDPIPYANILLMTVSDSSQVSGTISELDGEFELTGIREGQYLLKIQYLGYQNYFRTLLVDSNQDLGKISIKEEATALNEVIVAARRSTGSQRATRPCTMQMLSKP